MNCLATCNHGVKDPEVESMKKLILSGILVVSLASFGFAQRAGGGRSTGRAVAGSTAGRTGGGGGGPTFVGPTAMSRGGIGTVSPNAVTARPAPVAPTAGMTAPTVGMNAGALPTIGRSTRANAGVRSNVGVASNLGVPANVGTATNVGTAPNVGMPANIGVSPIAGKTGVSTIQPDATKVSPTAPIER